VPEIVNPSEVEIFEGHSRFFIRGMAVMMGLCSIFLRPRYRLVAVDQVVIDHGLEGPSQTGLYLSNTVVEAFVTTSSG